MTSDTENRNQSPAPRHRADIRWALLKEMRRSREVKSALALGVSIVAGSVFLTFEHAGEKTDHSQPAVTQSAAQTSEHVECAIESELPTSAAYSRAVIRDKLGVNKWHRPIYVMNVSCSPTLSETDLARGVRLPEIGTYEGNHFLNCVVMPSGTQTVEGSAEAQAYCLEEGRNA
jgi:hypothetical protein